MAERTVLQDAAEMIAANAMDVTRSTVTSGVDAKAIEWVILIEMIMSIITQFIERCQQPDPALRASIRDPSRRQRAWFYGLVKENCDCCSGSSSTWGWRRKTRAIADAAIDYGSSQDDVALSAVITDAKTGAL